MGFRSFGNTSSDYLRSAAAPRVTTTPLWLAARARTSVTAQDHIVGLYAAAGNNHFCLRFNNGQAGFNCFSGLTSEALAPTLVNDGQWVTIVGVAHSNSLRTVYARNMGNMGRDATIQTVSGIARASVGRRDDGTTANHLSGDVAWAAAGYGTLNERQIAAILAGESPLEVVRGGIRHYWHMVGGSTEPDLVGGLPLTVNGTTYTAGEIRTPRRRIEMPIVGVTATTRKIRARVSVGDVWYEAKIPLGSVTYGSCIMEIDDTAGELRLRLNDGTVEAVVLGGTSNTQTGDLYVGAGLNAGSVVSEGTDAARWSALHTFSTTLATRTRNALQGELADHFAPSTTTATLTVPSNDFATLDISPYVQDLEQGWSIVGVSSDTANWVPSVLSGNTIKVDTTDYTGSAVISVAVANNRMPRRTSAVRVNAEIVNEPFPNGFRYRRPFSFGPVTGATFSTLQKFPLLFDVAGTTWVKSVANGGRLKYNLNLPDVAFGAVDGTDFAHEIEPDGYDPVAGDITVWVGIPAWNPTAVYTGYVYYNDRLTVTNEDYSLWDNYVVVNHGGPSTRNPANTDLAWDVSGIVASTGYLGIGSDCAAADSLASITEPSTLNGHAALTITLAKKSASVTSDAGVIGAGDLSSDTAASLYVRDNASTTVPGGITIVQTITAKIATSGGPVRFVGPTGLTSTDYQVMNFTWGNGGPLYGYADGVLLENTGDDSSASGLTTCGVSPLVLGRSSRYATDGRWTTEFDEVRIAKVYRSQSWMWSEYNSWQPGFVTIGSEETPETAIERITSLPERIEINDTDAFVDIDVLASDIATNPLSISAVTQPTGGPVTSIVGTKVRFNRNGAPAATYSFTYTPTDGTVTGIATAVTVVVRAVAVLPVTLSIDAASATLAEPVSGSSLARFTVTRSGDTTVACSVNWAKSGTTAAADFITGQAFSGSVSFAAGETTKNIDLYVAADASVESAETIIVTLSGALPAGTVLATSSATTTVTNTLPAIIRISAVNATVTEGNSSEQNIDFTVTRSGLTSNTPIITWTKSGTTEDSDFNAGDDFGPTPMQFDAGQTSRTIRFRLKGDTTVETADETVIVTLSDPVDCVIATSTATTTILDNDAVAPEFPKYPPAATGLTLRVPEDYTLSQAVATAGAGDVISLDDGFYNSDLTIPLTTSGSAAGGYITIKARNHRKAIVNGTWTVNGDYIWITGLALRHPGSNPGSNNNAPFESPSFYSLVLRGKHQRVTNCRVDSTNGIWINSDPGFATDYIDICYNDFCSREPTIWNVTNSIMIGRFVDSSRGCDNVLIARNKFYNDAKHTQNTDPDNFEDADRNSVYTGNSKPGNNNSGVNTTVRFIENYINTQYVKRGIYTKRSNYCERNYIDVITNNGEAFTIRHGGYSNKAGTAFAAPIQRGVWRGNNVNQGLPIINDTDHLIISNRFANGLQLDCGSSRPSGNPLEHQAASRTILVGNTINGKLLLGALASNKHTLDDTEGGDVTGVKNYAAGITQPSGSNLVRENVVDGDTGYQELTGNGGFTTSEYVTATELLDTIGVGCDAEDDIVVNTPIVSVLPADPDVVAASYGGPTYYVSATGSGHSQTSSGSPGDLQATIQNANDGAIIVCASGSYDGFTLSSPKSGQVGRLKIVAASKAMTGTDVSSLDGLPTGYSTSGSHATLAGAITLDNFGGLWIEGFRVGKYTGTPATNARFLLGARSGYTNWYVRNAHYNVYTQQVVLDGPGSFACYQNYHSADGYDMYGVADYTSDYGYFATNMANLWAAENIFRGVMSKPISLKQNVGNGYITNNVIDCRQVVSGRSAAYMILLGQVCDAEIKDNTIGTALVRGNKLAIGATGTMIMSSNVAVATVEYNELTRTGGTPYVLMMDLIDEQYPSGGGTEPCTNRNPLHPSETIFRNNTINGGAANIRWALGKTWVLATAPNGRTKVSVSNNTVTGGGTIAAADWNASFPDGIGSVAARGANSSHTGDATIIQNFGPSPGLAVFTE